jgi:hypothetical protein
VSNSPECDGLAAHTYLYRMKKGVLAVEKVTLTGEPSSNQLKEFM